MNVFDAGWTGLRSGRAARAWGRGLAIVGGMKASEPRPRLRVRRTAEGAKAHILDAADQVFARYMPDEVGLKEVAKSAGVSHALLTYHFGTYAELVQAALDRRIEVARAEAFERLIGATFGAPGEAPLVELVFRVVQDRVTMRLLAWSILRGRAGQANLLQARRGSLKAIAAGIRGRLAALGHEVDAVRVETSVLMVVAMSLGLGIAGEALPALFDRDEPFEFDALGAQVALMVRAYLAAPAPTPASSTLASRGGSRRSRRVR